jgi:hypothetical protein
MPCSSADLAGPAAAGALQAAAAQWSPSVSAVDKQPMTPPKLCMADPSGLPLPRLPERGTFVKHFLALLLWP